jgi:hypothetical protein
MTGILPRIAWIQVVQALQNRPQISGAKQLLYDFTVELLCAPEPCELPAEALDTLARDFRWSFKAQLQDRRQIAVLLEHSRQFGAGQQETAFAQCDNKIEHSLRPDETMRPVIVAIHHRHKIRTAKKPQECDELIYIIRVARSYDDWEFLVVGSTGTIT